MRILSSKKLYLPALSIVAVVFLLLVIISVSTYRNLDREKTMALHFFYRQGVALLHSIEASARTGMKTMMWQEVSLGSLLQETAKDKDIELDKAAWEKFTALEAKRIMKRLGMKPGGGIPALMEALGFRLYAYLNRQEIVRTGPDSCRLTMRTCRVQDARKRKGLPDFPCKVVGIVEYSGFARTIDPDFETTCRVCPPEETPPDSWCSWEFVLRRK